MEGSVARGFEPVRDAFARNFREGRELGAAFALHHEGELVVDLWGGVRDARAGAPWERDTLVMTYSATKGMTATALAVAHSRGVLDYDAPVARYWPEFDQHGKGAITVRQLLAHEAGLAAIDRPIGPELLARLDDLARVLAAQRPAWPPGTRRGYHANSLGWYANELLRRADPRGRTVGRFFHDEVARPLGVDYLIGLPADVGAARVARIGPFRWAEAPRVFGLPLAFLAAWVGPDPLTRRTIDNPPARHPADLDRPEFHAVEMPASNGIGNARALARVYGSLATGGRELGLRGETLEQLTRYPADPPGGRIDRVLNVESVFSLGFSRPSASFRFGSSRRAFGAPGAGGSFGFADPDARLGYGYVMNRVGYCLSDDPRELALRRATYQCIGRTLGG